MASHFDNIDFSFRRGNHEGVINAPLKNGSLNFAMDTEELYVDIDNKRLNISGVKFFNTEEEIRSLTAIAPAVYIAYDTHKMMAYDPNISDWFYIGGAKDVVFAADVIYNNTESGLESRNVQGSTDEIVKRTWTGTQAEYDAIETPDPDTTYYITDGGERTVNINASTVLYDNSKSGLTSNNTQLAIDELNAKIKSLESLINELLHEE